LPAILATSPSCQPSTAQPATLSSAACVTAPPAAPAAPAAGTPLQNNLRELLALLAFMEDRSIEEVERRVKVGRLHERKKRLFPVGSPQQEVLVSAPGALP
jgi:3-oxoacyl-ACP reductase-like protein